MVSGHPGFSCSGIGSHLGEMMHTRTHMCSWTHAALKTPASLTQYSKSCHWNDDCGISRHKMQRVAGGCTPCDPPTGTCPSGGGARALPSCCPRSPSCRGPDGFSHLPVAPWCSQHAGAVSGVRDTCCSSSLGPQHCSQWLFHTQGLCRDCTGCNEHQFNNKHLKVSFFFFPTGSSRSKGEYLISLFSD